MRVQIVSTTLAFTSLCLHSTSAKKSMLRAKINQNKKEYPSSSRIIGGSEATPNKYSYAASLQDQIGHFCGGSLIAKDVILSAAHCQGGQYKAVLGRHDLKNRNDGQEIGMKREVPHPNYNDRTTDNDFMLVFLQSPATLNGDVSLVTLNNDASVPSTGDGVTVMGWGDTNISENISTLSDVLMKVQVNVISNQECDASSDGRDDYNGQITSNMLCAKANRQDSCQGDSGGPLVLTGTGGADLQIGVVSWGIGCADQNFPGVYARVSKAYDWIKSEVCNNSQYAEEAGFDCSNAEYNPVVSAPSPSVSSGSGGGNYNPAPSPSGGNGGGNYKPPQSGDDYYYGDDWSSSSNGGSFDDDWTPSSNGNGNNHDDYYYEDDDFSLNQQSGGKWDDDDWSYSGGSSGGWDDDWSMYHDDRL